MEENAPKSLTVLPNPRLFRAARRTQDVLLAVAAIAAVAGTLPLVGIERGGVSSAAARANLPILLAALLCDVSLFLSGAQRSKIAFGYRRGAGNLLAVGQGALIIFWMRWASAGNGSHNSFTPSAALGFVMLTLVVVLIDAKTERLNLVADALVCCLCLLSLFLVSNAALSRFALFASAAENRDAGAVLVCLVALSLVAALQQAEHGVFQIFLGAGMGSGLVRIFAPVLLLLPFAWGTVNALMSRSGSQGHVSAAVMASAGSVFTMGILLFFTWRINEMENEIHDLILRDEATRLYNQRGFYMLAEHALRLAQRAGIPFSVLFINFENLAEIHEQLGPDAAAASLAEAGVILRATFRESDIKGRIGADEFAVAGQFDRAGISVAALRLEAATAERSPKLGWETQFKFSMGHVTATDADAGETLKELLARASQMRNRMNAQLKEMLVN